MGERSKHGACRVLIVEDDDALRDTLAAILEFEGYAVCQARDGLHALQVLNHHTPELIILDLMLPRMDGFTFAAELERRGLRASIRILVLTADGRAPEKAARMAADAAMHKPFDLSLLLDEIERLLDTP